VKIDRLTALVPAGTHVQPSKWATNDAKTTTGRGWPSGSEGHDHSSCRTWPPVDSTAHTVMHRLHRGTAESTYLQVPLQPLTASADQATPASRRRRRRRHLGQSPRLIQRSYRNQHRAAASGGSGCDRNCVCWRVQSSEHCWRCADSAVGGDDRRQCDAITAATPPPLRASVTVATHEWWQQQRQ
jgi:hypothetical protein